MTAAEAQASVYLLLGQSSTDSQYSTTMVDDYVNIGRRVMATILPDKHLPALQVGSDVSQSVTSGYMTFPSDYLRMQENALVEVDSVIAKEIRPDEIWRMKFLESNDNVKSGSADKYYRFTQDGLEVYPTDATGVTLPYIKIPAELGVGDNSDLLDWVEDLTIDFAYERLIGTKMGGDLELAAYILKQRGLTINGAIANVRTNV